MDGNECYLALKPRDRWTAARDREGLVSAMSRRLEPVPGVSYNFTQHVAMRVDEVVSGIKADVAMKIFGEDPQVLEQLASSASRILSGIHGSADVIFMLLYATFTSVGESFLILCAVPLALVGGIGAL